MTFLLLPMIANVTHPIEPCAELVDHSRQRIGSPQQVVDEILRHHASFGHEVTHLHADGDGLTPRRHREVLELFRSEVAPAVRAAVPSRPFPAPLPRVPADTRPVGVAS